MSEKPFSGEEPAKSWLAGIDDAGGVPRLSVGEKFLLEWLGKEDASLHGECKGNALQRLVDLGLASIGPTPAGRTDDYALVRLTDAGIKAAAPDIVSGEAQ